MKFNIFVYIRIFFLKIKYHLIYLKLRRKYTYLEIAENFVFPNLLYPHQKDKANKVIINAIKLYRAIDRFKEALNDNELYDMLRPSMKLIEYKNDEVACIDAALLNDAELFKVANVINKIDIGMYYHSNGVDYGYDIDIPVSSEWKNPFNTLTPFKSVFYFDISGMTEKDAEKYAIELKKQMQKTSF